MADTSEQQALSEPHTNGVMDGLTEEEKSKMRPADIDADMREMERRKRVEMMMNSRLFREELERIIETQMKDGAGPSGLLQQISDMMGAQGARFNGNVFKNSNCVLPINDIRGVESMGYAKGEKLLRCKLSAVFRLLDLYGWTQGVGGQITARLNQDQEHFLVNPYGLLYHEVTASSLVKVDMQGTIVEQGTTNFGIHVTGFQLHSTIHAARPDIKCIVHITTPSVTAISSLKCGLLPIGQESIVIGEVSTHQYIGGSFEPEEKEKIARNLGPVNKVMLLTNRGALCCGETVEEAFFNVYNMVLACETQLKLMPAGLDNLNLISEESKKAIFEASRKPPSPQQTAPISESTALAEKLEKRWRIGGTEFEALMRMLDNAGFRTGYIYRNPLVKGEPPRPRNDVEVPPAVSSLGYLLEEEELYKQGLWKGGRKGTDRSRWLNSPNVYQKVEILETGTPDPKKITKWVSDGSPTHSSTPVKIDSALQFVPKNTNPKEFKQIQQQIKDYRRADKISAGPQSHILEGVTWEEAKKMQDATISGTGEQVVLVGAASKGIIQRGFQHNAMVYKTPYAKNPFDAVTDQELDQYKKEVERKQKGDPYDESQSESEALSSFNASRATHESSTAKSPIQSPVSVTSETEEESRDEPRVLRIETKQVPAPSQPEVVLSDDRDSSSRYCSQSENENDQENGNEVCIDCKHRNRQVVELFRHEPRLEIARTDVIAERMTATIIAYTPPPFLSKVDTSYKFFENVSNSSYREKNNEWLKEPSNEQRRNAEPKTNGNSLDLNRERTTDSLLSLDEKAKGENRRMPNYNSATNTNSLKRIVQLVNSVDSNVPLSNRKLSGLFRSDFKISTKYNLDSVDMSLLYSLTPFVDSECPENIDEITLGEPQSPLPTLSHERNPDHSSLRSNEKRSFECKQQQWKEKERMFEEIYDCIWLGDPFDDSERYELGCAASLELANSSFSSDNERSEICSNEGSDMLELPADTVLQLLEINGEIFRNDISDSANEIIAELDANDTYTSISCLVAEIFERVCTLCSMQLNGQRNTFRSSTSSFLSRSTPSPIHPFSSSTLLSNLNNDDDDDDDDDELVSKECAKRQTIPLIEDLDEHVPVRVVHEIVHHLIDANDESELKYLNTTTEMVNCSFKKAKDTANVELKEARNATTVSEGLKVARVERQINDSTTISADQSTKDHCQIAQLPSAIVSFDSLIETDKERNESVIITEPGETTEAQEATFEFRTIARRKSTESNDDKAFELNFRVETNRDSETIFGDGRPNKAASGRIENSVRNGKRCGDTYFHNKSDSLALLSNASSSSESANNAERDVSLNNSFESDSEETEVLNESKLNDPTESFESCELCVECISCTNFCAINHCQAGPLPSIDEETDDRTTNVEQILKSSLLLNNDRISEINTHSKVEGNCCNNACTCCDDIIDRSDQELSGRELENTRNECLPKLPRLNSQTAFSSSAMIHSYEDANFVSLEFA